jgi:hypothetical protein
LTPKRPLFNKDGADLREEGHTLVGDIGTIFWFIKAWRSESEPGATR